MALEAKVEDSRSLFRITAETLGTPAATKLNTLNLQRPAQEITSDEDIETSNTDKAVLARKSRQRRVGTSTAQGDDQSTEEQEQKQQSEQRANEVMVDMLEEQSDDWYDVADIGQKAWDDAGDFLNETWDDADKFVSGAWNSFAQTAEDTVNSVTDGVSGVANDTLTLGGKAVDYANNTISDGYYSAKEWLLGKSEPTAPPPQLVGDENNVTARDTSLTTNFTSAATGNNTQTATPDPALTAQRPQTNFIAAAPGGMG